MRFAQEISIFNPFAIERQVIALGTSITQTAREIELRADELYAEKGSVYDLSSRLTIVAGQITSEVTARENGDATLSSKIDQTADSITTEVTNITDSLSSRIEQSPHTISLSVSGTASKNTGASITLTVKDENGEQISKSTGTVKIDGDVIFTNDLYNAGTTQISGSRIRSGTLALGGASNDTGQLRVYDANNVEIGRWSNAGISIKHGEITLGQISGGYNFRVTDQGVITAKSGKIGDMSIGDGLQYGKTSIDDAQAGLYLGPDGFAVGQLNRYTGFSVASDGTPLANYLAFTNNAGGRSSYGLWCDTDGSGRIASGGALHINTENRQTTWLYGNNQIDGYQKINSDRRQKKNIRYLTPEEATEFILTLKPCEFEFIDEMQEEYEFYRGVRHGFIAQDVLEALGDEAGKRSLVAGHSWDEMYELRYDELTADLVGICQQQQRLIDDLEQRLSDVEALHDGDGK